MALAELLARIFAAKPEPAQLHEERAALRDEQVAAVLDGVQELKRALARFEHEMDAAGVRAKGER
jgi:hypothetical protein